MNADELYEKFAADATAAVDFETYFVSQEIDSQLAEDVTGMLAAKMIAALGENIDADTDVVEAIQHVTAALGMAAAQGFALGVLHAKVNAREST